MFEVDYENLSRADQNRWSESLNELLFRSFVVRKTYDRVRRMSKINPDYLFIESHIEMINSYLVYMDLEARIDEADGVISLASLSGSNSIRFDGITTLVVYLLRYTYEKSLSEKPNVTEVHLDSNDLKELLKDKGFLKMNKRLNMNTVSSALKTLSTYNLVSRVENTFSDSYYSFMILPSIRHAISNAKLNVLHEKIEEANRAEEGLTQESEALL